MRLLLIFSLLITARAESFRVGLANIFFMSAMFDDNQKEPIFGEKVKNPPSSAIEKEFDRLTKQLLARYFAYLDSDILVICEADYRPEILEQYSQEYLDNRYTVIHNAPIVKDKSRYHIQQIMAYVDKSKFIIRRYEALDKKDVTDLNRLYPFPAYKTINYEGKAKKIYWSRYPIEFDLALKSDPTHWYKFIATYPKSKFSRNEEAAKLARTTNRVQQEMLRDRIEEIAKEYEDIIVLGDMNDSIGMDEYELASGEDSIKGLYFGKDDPILWNPVLMKPNEGSFIFKGVPETIDYIFVSHGLKKGKGQTKLKVWEYDHFYRTMIKDRQYPNPDRLENRELFISDHGPVTIDIRH